MFVKHVPPLCAYFMEEQDYKVNISRAFTPAKFDEHELFPKMHT